MPDNPALNAAIKAMARHVFLCWPRRWSYEYGRHDAWSYRRTCMRCGLVHEHDA